MSRRQTLLPTLTLASALLLGGCGGGGGGGGGGGTTPPPTPIIVAVTPAASDVAFGMTQQFTATVTGAANTAVTWSVGLPGGTPVMGGNSQVGTINSSGLYTAPSPAQLPNPLAGMSMLQVSAGASTPAGTVNLTPQIPSTTVTVTATSQADTTKSASATVTIAPLSLFAVGTCGTTQCQAGSTGISINQGATATLFLVGEGLASGTTICFSGPSGNECSTTNGSPTDITITSVNFAQTQGSPSYPAAEVGVTISPTAPIGPRNIMVTDSAGELAAFPGGLRICSATTGGCGQ